MKRKPTIIKRLAFAIIPLVAILAVTELGLRISGVADSTIMPLALPGENSYMHRPDEDLFWALQPNAETLFQGITARTNSIGLRNDEITAKQPHQFRILSLGESTTFGAGVENDDTYAARLQARLNQDDPTERFNVINAGVSGYTSFQSLVYLQRDGLKLAPDMVLFYHELNDYLPTTVTNHKNTVIGLSLTDKERYLAKRWRLHRRLLALCATYRGIHFFAARVKIKLFQRAAARSEPGNWRLIMGSSAEPTDYPRRVSTKERIENLQKLLALSKDHGFQLVIIHPSYQGTQSHECELTRFCADHRVPMFETYNVLHPPRHVNGALFWDAAHPTPKGHDLLAEALAQFLKDNHLIPTTP